MLGGNPEFLAKEKLLSDRPSLEWTVKGMDKEDVYGYFVRYSNLQAEDLARNYLRDRRIAEEGSGLEFLRAVFGRIKKAYEARLEEFH